MKLFRRATMNCMQVGRHLQTFLDGELDAERSQRLAAHLEDCRRCGLEADTYRRIKASIERRPSANLTPEALARLRSFGDELARHGDHEEDADAG